MLSKNRRSLNSTFPLRKANLQSYIVSSFEILICHEL